MSEWNAHRFYFEKDEVHDGLVRLPEEEAHHALKVLRLGAGDAAYTAWLCGAIMALTFPLTQWVRRRQGIEPRFDVRCAWDSETLVGSVQGIIALLPGDIMAALVLAAAQKLRKEAKRRWTGIPLKA